MTALAEPAFHPSLKREVDLVVVNVLFVQLFQNELVHDRRTTDHGVGIVDIYIDAWYEFRNQSNVTAPARVVRADVDSCFVVNVLSLGPLLNFVLEHLSHGFLQP